MGENIRKLGELTIQQGLEEAYENNTASRQKSTGRITYFLITGEGVNLKLGYAEFINGERDIRTIAVLEDFDTFGRLKHGLRLSVLPHPSMPRTLYSELKQALPKDASSTHQTLHSVASEDDLNEGASLSVFAELRNLGAEVGTRQSLLGDTGSRSNCLCARFRTGNMWAPVVAYVATRVLPIARGYTGAWTIKE